MSDIDTFLSNQKLPCVVALATTAEETVYEGAFGGTNTETNEAVAIDTPFAIMSMTKPITSIAALCLVEQGRLDLDAPGADYLPEYQNLQVLKAIGPGKQYTTEPQRRPFTIRDLLTHTSGIGYSFCNTTLQTLRPESDALPFPLVHQPGERWTYGASTRLLGEVIAGICGSDLESALRSLVLDPLGMTQTSFEPKQNQARVHVMFDDKWHANDLGPAMPMGDGGLISTAPDYARFVRCLLRRGEPLISDDMFEQAISNQIGELFVTEQPAANPAMSHPFPDGAGVDKWGLGFQLHMKPGRGMRSPGSFSWCGLYNTYFWVDPVKNIGGIVMMQLLPLYEPICRDTVSGFEQRLYQRI